jgi:nitrilase
MSQYRVAAIQMVSSAEVDANLHEAARLINEAAQFGAELVVLPENFAQMAMYPKQTVQIRELPQAGPLQEFLSQQAARHRLWLVGGSLPLVANHDNKYRPACLLFDNTGQCVARYDKIHLFDVTTTSGENYCESEVIEAGNQVVVAQTPFGRLGLAICYDLRFPELFRSMLNEGVDLLAVPAAFTAVTGKAHWEILLQVRAVENLCYVIAANQGGYHANKRETYGNSMIVDPWGIVMTRLIQGSGVVYVDISREKQENLRLRFPALSHRRIHCQSLV